MSTAQHVRDLIRAGHRTWAAIAGHVGSRPKAREALRDMLESGVIVPSADGDYRMASWARTEEAYQSAVHRASQAVRPARREIPSSVTAMIDAFVIRR